MACLGSTTVRCDAVSWGSTPQATVQYTPHPFGPHAVWYLSLVAGLGLAVNGINNTTDMAQPQLFAAVTIAGGSYGLSLLADQTGNHSAPVGSWISKMSFGNASTSSGTVPFWPTATIIVNPNLPTTGFYPSSDSQLPNGSATMGAGLIAYAQFLVSDFSGQTRPETGAAHSSHVAPLVASTTASQLLTTGPC